MASAWERFQRAGAISCIGGISRAEAEDLSTRLADAVRECEALEAELSEAELRLSRWSEEESKLKEKMREIQVELHGERRARKEMDMQWKMQLEDHREQMQRMEEERDRIQTMFDELAKEKLQWEMNQQKKDRDWDDMIREHARWEAERKEWEAEREDHVREQETTRRSIEQWEKERESWILEKRRLEDHQIQRQKQQEVIEEDLKKQIKELEARFQASEQREAELRDQCRQKDSMLLQTQEELETMRSSMQMQKEIQPKHTESRKTKEKEGGKSRSKALPSDVVASKRTKRGGQTNLPEKSKVNAKTAKEADKDGTDANTRELNASASPKGKSVRKKRSTTTSNIVEEDYTEAPSAMYSMEEAAEDEFEGVKTPPSQRKSSRLAGQQTPTVSHGTAAEIGSGETLGETPKKLSQKVNVDTPFSIKQPKATNRLGRRSQKDPKDKADHTPKTRTLKRSAQEDVGAALTPAPLEGPSLEAMVSVNRPSNKRARYSGKAVESPQTVQRVQAKVDEESKPKTVSPRKKEAKQIQAQKKKRQANTGYETAGASSKIVKRGLEETHQDGSPKVTEAAESEGAGTAATPLPKSSVQAESPVTTATRRSTRIRQRREHRSSQEYILKRLE